MIVMTLIANDIRCCAIKYPKIADLTHRRIIDLGYPAKLIITNVLPKIKDCVSEKPRVLRMVLASELKKSGVVDRKQPELIYQTFGGRKTDTDSGIAQPRLTDRKF